MVRSVVILILLGLVGLFAYFFFTDTQTGDLKTRAQAAAQRVGDKVIDEGVATAVYAHLVSKHGREAMRFVHVYHDQGRVLVYGLAPATLNPETLRVDATGVPGVSAVQVLVQPRPEPAVAPPPGQP